MTAYYNEIDPYAAQWLRNLIEAGHIAPGVVDERSVELVRMADLSEYTQCHFFAGVGVWSLALRQAGWPDDRPVWTGSCPCQPFSSAGAKKGLDDTRHLWPHFARLIGECRPPVVFGEQVAGKAVDSWIDLVHADLEAMGYAFGCIAFPSAGVGAPHIRDRFFWVGESSIGRWSRQRPEPKHRQSMQADEGFGERGQGIDQVNGFWADADWLLCGDGQWRPIEPGTFPLADGAAARVGRLRAYGNAVNAEAARVFIEAFVETRDL